MMAMKAARGLGGSDMTTTAEQAASPRYASPVDFGAYGQYGAGRGFDSGQAFQRPRYPFRGRITADGASGYRAEPGRYHLYISWGCPWAQRTAIVRKIMGLEDVVSLSHVDDRRDGRGWAFRASRGPDPVNGFTLLAQAYEATEPAFSGHVSVPVLWDRQTAAIVSNNFPDITVDLGTAFGAYGDPSADLYPAALRGEIDALNERVYETVNDGTYRVAGATTEQDYEQLRHRLIGTFEYLEERLAGRRYLFGAAVTEADVRLWPTLARFDLGYNPLAKISTRRLVDFPVLWAYSRDLYQQRAFRETTEFSSFARFGAGPVPSFVNDADWRIRVEPYQADWDTQHGRQLLG
jgi:glutathionyl-hydroquinone reductase